MILASVSTIPPGSGQVSTITCWLYLVTFHYLLESISTLHNQSINPLNFYFPLQPPPRIQLNFDFSFLLLLAGDGSLNPGPSVHGLCLRTVNVCSMWDKVPALSDLVTSNGIDLLRITETWVTMRETSVDLAKMNPQAFSFQEPRPKRRGEGEGLFISSDHKFTAISLPICKS